MPRLRLNTFADFDAEGNQEFQHPCLMYSLVPRKNQCNKVIFLEPDLHVRKRTVFRSCLFVLSFLGLNL